MSISTSHTVLIIDNEYIEALPIIKIMNKKGIPTIYWDGNVDTKPGSPLKGIRFLFLDMRYSAATDSRTINANLFQLIKSAIDINNGPYILFIWSKHDSRYLQEFVSELETVPSIPKPFETINMDKSRFIGDYQKVFEECAVACSSSGVSGIDSDYDIMEIMKSLFEQVNHNSEISEEVLSELQNKIDEAMKEINSLSFLLKWEEIVYSSVKDMVGSIAGFSENGKDWNNNIQTLIHQLALANAGKTLENCECKDYITNAMLSMNQMLPDAVMSQLMQTEINDELYNSIAEPFIIKTVDEDKYTITKLVKQYIVRKNNSDYTSFKDINRLNDGIDKELVKELYDKYQEFSGKSNFKLLCESSPVRRVKKPGKIYQVEDVGLLDQMKISIFKEGTSSEIMNNNSLIKLDISSSCDYAQDKLDRIRVLPGILVKEECFSYIENAGDIYVSPALFFENKLIKLVFCFHYITNDPKNCYDEFEPIFSLRDLILSDVKHKLSVQISRIGIINL